MLRNVWHYDALEGPGGYADIVREVISHNN
jgi:hypothetical protein